MAQAPANTALMQFRDLLEKQTSQFALVIAPETVEKFKRTVVTTLNENPNLLRLNPRSIISVCMRAAQDGLMLDGKEAAIVPFRDQAQYVPMIQGIRKKVMQSGFLKNWECTAVQEGDEFDISLGTSPFIRHIPSLQGGRKRPLIGVYSIAYFRDSDVPSIEWMNRDAIEDVRGKSKSASGPWSDPIFYVEMARKTCARNHAKRLPQSSDVSAFFERLDNDDGAVTPTPPVTALPRSQPASVAATLDEFGAGLEQNSLLESSPTDGDTRADERAAGITQEDIRGPEQPKPTEVDAIKRAYRRGQDDRKAGRAADDMPQEYTSNERNREQVAWWSGYDGKPLPTWPDQGAHK
jgi:recombination protein RecT